MGAEATGAASRAESAIKAESASRAEPAGSHGSAVTAEKLLTEVCAPWVVLTAGSVYLGRRVGSPGWGLATAAGLGVVPQAAIAWRVRRKALSDHHVTRREDRPLVIVGIAGSVAVLLAAQRRHGAPDELHRMTRAALVALGVAGAATLKVKVSFHTAVLAGVVAVLARELSPRHWRLLALVPPVAWARVRISHHTPAETTLGAMIGMACGYLGGDRVSAVAAGASRGH